MSDNNNNNNNNNASSQKSDEPLSSSTPASQQQQQQQQQKATFHDVWRTLYAHSMQLVDKNNNNKTTRDHEKAVLSVLNTIIKLVFGLDETKKAFVVSYGHGGLHLIVSLLTTTTTTTEDYDLVLAGVKAIRCCVIRNAVGRSRCRSDGVLDWIETVLSNLVVVVSNQQDAPQPPLSTVVEETLTTLAAVCLGDDLNALQASVRLRSCVEQAKTLFITDKSQQDNKTIHSLNQKITYLLALFDAIDKEQSQLLLLSSSTEDRIQLMKDLQQAERDYQKGIQLLLSAEEQEQGDEQQQDNNKKKANIRKAIALWTNALKTVKEGPATATGLLDGLVYGLHYKRCAARALLLQETDWEGIVEDANACLGMAPQESLSVVELYKHKATALVALNRANEAKETLGKAILQTPHDASLSQMMKDLELTNDE